MINLTPYAGDITRAVIPDSAKQTQTQSASEPIGSLEWLEQKAAAGGNEWAIDYLTNYRLSQDSINDARAWTAEREDTQYQRMVADLKKAGINPYFALTGGNPISSSSQGVNYQGSYNNSAANNIRTNETSKWNNARTNDANLAATIIKVFGQLASSALGVIANT